MSRTRLPRPQEIVERCRLCEAALEVSVENPRRVCPHCGEINLPTDGEPVVAPEPLLPPRPAPQPVRWVASPGRPLSSEPLQLIAGAAVPLLATVIGMVFGTRHGDFEGARINWLGLTFTVLPPFAMVSFLGAVIHVAATKARWGVVGLFWLGGLVGGSLLAAAATLVWIVLGFFAH